MALTPAEKSKRYRQRHPEKIKAANAKRVWVPKPSTRVLKTEEELKETSQKYNKKWYEENKEALRFNRIFKAFGVTREEYEEIEKSQDYKCEICKTPLQEISLKNRHLDHCHQTSKIRGILCNCCNQALGLLKDNKEVLLEAIKYLEKHDG